MLNCTMFELEKVLGVTVNSNGALASNSKVDLLAYPAGSTIVLVNTTSDQQHHIINLSKKAIKSLAFTSCGKHLVISEHGKNSGFKIWSVHGDNRLIGEITQENGGTRCFAISPNDTYIVAFDILYLSVWNWKENIKIAGCTIDTDVRAVSFSEDGKYFVSAGNKNVKFWFLEETSLSGRLADLGELKDISFCDIACGKGRCHRYTYAVTRKGVLCIFNDEQHLETWVELQTITNSLIASNKYVFVGCAEATIYCFDSVSLEYMFNLPKCHFLGVDICGRGSSKRVQEDVRYPDTIAMTFNEVTNTIACIYNDHSLYIWDLRNTSDITKSRSFLYHSNCIWGINIVPSGEKTFLTCSSDNTIRLWSTDKGNLEKIVYLNEDYKYLKDITRNKDDDVYYGVRCIATSPDGQFVASGDRRGIIRIHEFPSLKESLELEEHDSEVLYLEYTPSDCNCRLLASAGKDKNICLFDVTTSYSLIQKINDHSSSVTTVKFAGTNSKELKIISSSSDGDCIIRSLIFDENNSISVVTEYKLAIRKILYAIELDRGNKYLFLASQNLKIYDLKGRKLIKKLKSPHKESFVFKVALDSSSKYIAASCLDKSIVVYDFASKEYLETMYSNLVTNLCFTNDCKRLIAVTGDGCIFIWKINVENEAVLQCDDASLPAWAKKARNKTANIELSTKSTIPRGKWATRMEETISIKGSYVTDESDASPQSPHTYPYQYFKIDHDVEKQTDKEEVGAKDGRGKFVVNTPISQIPVAPGRKIQKSNLKKMSAYSISSDAINNKILQKNKIGNLRRTEDNGKIAKSIGSNLELRTPVDKRRTTGGKREKASQMIGQVKEKLEDIEHKNQIKSKKSSLVQPNKGTWLLTYRSSIEDQKNQASKSKTVSNSSKSDFDTETESRRKSSKPINLTNNTTNTREDSTKDFHSTASSNSAGNQVKYKLSLPRPQLLLRTATDSQIVIRRSPKNVSNLTKLNRQLSASNNELYHSSSLQNLNVSTVKITERLCEKVASELVETAAKAVDLYKKFINDTSAFDINAMENLVLSLVWAQIKLERLNIKDN